MIVEVPNEGHTERQETPADQVEKEGICEIALESPKPRKKKPLKKEHSAIVAPSGE